MRKVLISLLLLMLVGCNAASNRVSSFEFGESHVLATTGNLRLVTERKRIQPNGLVLNTICTEPSPDYAIAFGSNAALSGSSTAASGIKSDLSASYASTEQATALAGRTAGVLALRDGLYAACQSYANGVIGHDAYAMILSQYGDLLVALVGNTSTDSGGATAQTTASSTASAKDEAAAAKPAAPQKLTTATRLSTSGGTDPMKKSTLAALLVACISENDPTRYRAGPQLSRNPLLNEKFCQQVVASALRLATSANGHG